MIRRAVIIDAGIAVVAAVLLIVMAPGLAVVGLVALLVLLVCAISLALDRRRRPRRRGRSPIA